MAAGDVEIVRELLDAFARRDHERAFEFYDPEIEWDARRLDKFNPDLAEVFHGYDGVRTYWRRWLSAWRDIDFDVQDVREGEDGEVVALIANQRQWGRASGVETIVDSYGLVFTCRDGKVVRWRAFSSQAEALDTAGLGG